MTLYQKLIAPATQAALDQLYKDQDATGTTPEDDMDVLAGLIVAARAHNILQFGTFLGGSSLVLADLLKQNGEAYRFVTVDPNPAMNASCRKYAELAGLTIETFDGFSTDPGLIKHLSATTWDVVFLDTTHQYAQTVAEIAAIAPLCGPGTLFLFHDASAYAADTLDMGHQGGVRRAMREYCLNHPKWQWFIFEGPAFGKFGIGLMQKRAAP